MASAGSAGTGTALTLGDLVRHEVVARQLDRHLADAPSRVLDVGSGGPRHALRLARAGHRVLLLQPDRRLREAAVRALAGEPEPVRSRLTLEDGSLDRLADHFGTRRFDVVTCHAALAVAPATRDAVVQLSDLVAPGGLVSLVAPNADGMALAPARQRRWADALDLLAAADDPKPGYGDERGGYLRAHRLEELASYVAGRRMHVEAWYGVGVLTAGGSADEPAPSDPDERDALLAAEELAGRTDPYRRVAPRLHVIGRRSAG